MFGASHIVNRNNVRMVEANPRKFYIPAYLGPRGWVGLRLDVGKIDWSEVEALVAWSYCKAAPKRLAAIVSAR